MGQTPTAIVARESLLAPMPASSADARPLHRASVRLTGVAELGHVHRDPGLEEHNVAHQRLVLKGGPAQERSMQGVKDGDS